MAAEESVKAAESTRDKKIMLIGNLVPDSVPVSNDEVCDRLLNAGSIVVLRMTSCLNRVTTCVHAAVCSLQVDNVVVKTYGELREEDGLRNHVDLVQMLDIVDLEAGTMVAGVHVLSFRPEQLDTPTWLHGTVTIHGCFMKCPEADMHAQSQVVAAST